MDSTSIAAEWAFKTKSSEALMIGLHLVPVVQAQAGHSLLLHTASVATFIAESTHRKRRIINYTQLNLKMRELRFEGISMKKPAMHGVEVIGEIAKKFGDCGKWFFLSP